VLQARAFGVPGFFNTSPPNFFSDQFASLYSLAPSLRRIEQLVDFTLLNATPTRVSIATTDISTGDLVVFENRGGEPIRIDHLAASCGFLPEFAPVEIDGRLLGDGGLAANAPLEALLADDADLEDTAVFVVDLYARDGDRPRDLGSALARKSDLLFGNQTWLRLQALVRELQLKAQIEKLRRKQHTAQLPKFFYLSYRGSAAEPGSEKPFSFSQHAIRSRWEAGVLDMQAALAQVDTSHALTAIRRA
jgi:NTE family protein